MTAGPDAETDTPTLFEWARGGAALSRLTRIFCGYVKDDPLLAPVFAEMSPEHPGLVAQWLGDPRVTLRALGR